MKQVINLNKVTFWFIIERKIKMWWLSDSKIMYSLVGYVSRPRMARELRQRLACAQARPAQRHLATRLRQCGNEETGGVKPWQQRHQPPAGGPGPAGAQQSWNKTSRSLRLYNHWTGVNTL